MKQDSFEELSELPNVRLVDLRTEVERELQMRVAVYPKWIERGKIDQNTADWRIKVFDELLELLRGIEKQMNKYK